MVLPSVHEDDRIVMICAVWYGGRLCDGKVQ